ncbi:hypothetical protein [uncultured Methanobrevibacter sp.]|uniref:hypothetical protein n=1 Tax=uncultured Methanobrevibacter sp. TaxID=253161 RepID=UPI0025FB44E1|nr:hypothetical protein [uncultured Methanobrevibacter sp.]
MPLNVQLNGDAVYITDVKGQVKVPIMGLGSGVHFAIITFLGNKQYGASVTTARVELFKVPSLIIVSNVTADWKDDDYLVLSLIDSDANPLTDVLVSVDLNGKANYTTDKNGQIKVPTKELHPGTYDAKITFGGNERCYGCSATAKVKINSFDVICDAQNLMALKSYIDAMGAKIEEGYNNVLHLQNDIQTINDKLIITINQNKDIIIDGQGHTIDLNGSNKHDHYFVVKSGHLIFRNINFINGYNKAGDKGGAISFEDNAIGTIINCTFRNCWAEDHGGAIADRTGNTLTLINSTFIGNKASDDNGGAIFCKGPLYVEDCLFESNNAKVDGGAIFCENDMDVIRSVFNFNKASGAKAHQCYGGAICAKGTVYIDNSTFENNTSKDYGGAVYAKNIYVN